MQDRASGIPYKSYTTWDAGLAFTWKQFTLDLRYYDTDLSNGESPEGMEPEETKPQQKKPEEQKSSKARRRRRTGRKKKTARKASGRRRPEEKRSQDKEPGKKEVLVALCSQFRRPRDLCWSRGRNIFCHDAPFAIRLIHIRRGRPLVPRRDPRVTQTGISDLHLEAVHDLSYSDTNVINCDIARIPNVTVKPDLATDHCRSTFLGKLSVDLAKGNLR